MKNAWREIAGKAEGDIGRKFYINFMPVGLSRFRRHT